MTDKHKPARKKLRLDRETVGKLENAALADVRGGNTSLPVQCGWTPRICTP